jgi:hypothetical protein
MYKTKSRFVITSSITEKRRPCIMHHAPKSGMHHPSPEPSDVRISECGGLDFYAKLFKCPGFSFFKNYTAGSDPPAPGAATSLYP